MTSDKVYYYNNLPSDKLKIKKELKINVFYQYPTVTCFAKFQKNVDPVG